MVVEGLSKTYSIYGTPLDRVRHSLLRRDGFCVDVPSLRDVSFAIEAGEVFGIVGRNGSGKSTLLKLLAGVLTPDQGRVFCSGRIAALLELAAGFNPTYTGRQNAQVSATLMGLTLSDANARMDQIEAFADIGDFFDRPVNTYSSGMVARVAFAVASHLDANVLLLDEILAVGDEAFQRKCFSRLRDLADSGCAIVFVSHASQLVIELCDRAMLLDQGVCRIIGRPKEVVHEYHQMTQQPATQTISKAPPAEGSAAYDPALQSESRKVYAENGASITAVRILDESGREVNVLSRDQTYRLSYTVTFTSSVENVEFGSLIKTVSGVELGGILHRPSQEAGNLAAGTVLDVRLPFRCSLLPGTYFFNAGVRGNRAGEFGYLHRILDALMFRVGEEADLTVSGMVDFSTAQAPTVIEQNPRDGDAG